MYDLLNCLVELLQGAYALLRAVLVLFDTFYGCLGSSHGSYVADAALDGCLTDVAVINRALLAGGSIDDQVYFLVRDRIQNVRASLTQLEDAGYRDAFLLDHIAGTTGRNQLEAALMQASC